MKKPKTFLILKIVGFIGLAILGLAVYLLITGFGDFDSNNFLFGMFLMPLGFGVGIFCTILGFMPEIQKMSAQNARYIQQENKDNLKNIATTNAEVQSEAIKMNANAFGTGLSESFNSNKQQIYCKHCGNKIDIDSKFCKYCGKSQD